uniref:exodeoxyribonuclease III n=1 Tax=Leptobrachium leishanense TaxID=445787 RepID=A0A8C5QZ09_9ANUR
MRLHTHADLVIVSINANGLNVPEKSRLIRELCALKASIVFLQETHFCRDMPTTLTSRPYPEGYYSNYIAAKSRGTAILFSHDVPFQLEEQQINDEGRYIFLRGKILGTQYTFASIYLPNTGQHKCLARILKRLTSFSSGILVLAGDFNVPLDPRMDTSRKCSSIP